MSEDDNPWRLIAAGKDQPCIIVTIGYRLNLFGFLALEDLVEEEGTTGNYGLWDQRMGLEWVRDHISAFGGNQQY